MAESSSGGGGASGASGATEDSSSPGDAAGGTWPSAGLPAVVVDDSAATTEIQVRLPGAPQRFKLNKTHTVAALKQLVEAALAKSGEAPRKYSLLCGFPPKPLSDDSATVEAAGLVGAAVTHRWV